MTISAKDLLATLKNDGDNICLANLNNLCSDGSVESGHFFDYFQATLEIALGDEVATIRTQVEVNRFLDPQEGVVRGIQTDDSWIYIEVTSDPEEGALPKLVSFENVEFPEDDDDRVLLVHEIAWAAVASIEANVTEYIEEHPVFAGADVGAS